MSATSPTTPSTQLLGNLQLQLTRHAPFAQMRSEHVAEFLASAQEAYFAPGEVLLAPSDGPCQSLICLRQGAVTSRDAEGEAPSAFQYEAGALFPVDALMGARPVRYTYRAQQDVFALVVPAAEVRALAERSAPFADFLARRVWVLLDLSRRALQVSFASQTLAEQSMETPLGELMRGQPFGVEPATPLSQALQAMHERRIGSVLVLTADGQAQGILTRHDILGRVTLKGRSLDTPIADVMTAPVHTLGVTDTAQDAAMLMSRESVRHVPVTDGARVVGIISERDLFALQRLSLKQVSTAIRAARNVDTLVNVAADIRRFATNLLGQGVAARQLTELISHLNDVLTERLVQVIAQDDGVDMRTACWLSFGSEGRSEQTISTDQDNGLVFESDDAAAERPRWLAFARRVNEALDRCGYPLCTGNIMASNPECCLTPVEWRERFSHWIDQGEPEHLLKSSIFFDMRPLAGHLDLAQALGDHVRECAAHVPRFLKQMAANALANRAPLNWHGGIETREVDGHRMVDLKLHGTMMFVDAARLYALANGVGARSTRARFEAVGKALAVPAHESEGWIGAFEYLQMLRLRTQIAHGKSASGNPNTVAFDTLNDIDRRVLQETYRTARRLQQRIELDWSR